MDKQRTSIMVTPPNGTAYQIRLYDSVSVRHSSSDRSGEYSITMRNNNSNLIDSFPIGSDVQINQDGYEFRGWVLNPAKALDANIRSIQLDGPDYTARTKKIIVTESFAGERVDFIVNKLFTDYVPWASNLAIEDCPTVISIRFGDVFLWDAMEQICQIVGYEWFIDHTLKVNFFKPGGRINPNIIKTGNFKRGTASLKPDSSKLVNRLWVKGGKALSDNYSQPITVGSTPIPLYYTPRATTEGVIVIVDGVQRSVGIQNITPIGTTDFLLNFSEKLLIPDLLTSGTGTITYRYEYPIKLLLEEPNSQEKYGIFEDIYTVNTTDREIALEIGLRYLGKYSQPVMTGSIEPFRGVYRAGEVVKVEVPELNVDSYLQIREVSYASQANTGVVSRRLELESPERTLTNVLKSLDRRLSNLEGGGNDDDPVERFIATVDEGFGWKETSATTVNACPIPSENLYPSEVLYPC